MRFWDTSAVVPLTVRESETRRTREILSQDDVMAVFYATEVECVSALSRRLREGNLDQPSFDGAIDILIVLLEHWLEILPTHDLRLDAEVLLTLHPLRTADALQLAAALLWCEGDTEGREFVSLDNRLREAADNEGFTVLPNQSRAGV
ncbi:MAG: type II toxin-antitoxin system VapC family toxin [Rubrobacter sp.]|nr:type II toxin-antitoxin system VapC family toxin [Rubrobacter sp.]